jgi:hypothetical protein
MPKYHCIYFTAQDGRLTATLRDIPTGRVLDHSWHLDPEGFAEWRKQMGDSVEYSDVSQQLVVK